MNAGTRLGPLAWSDGVESDDVEPVVDGGQFMIDVTQDAIQVLLDHPRAKGMIVSCYANTSMTGGFQWLWSQHLKNEASAIEQRLKNDHQARARFARDLEIVRRVLEAPAVQSTRGMAVFCAADEGLLRTFSLGLPVTDRLVLDETPYLVPLLEAMHRQRRYLLVLADSHRGHIYEAAWGHTRLLLQIEEAIPRRQRSAGERWGKQQATIARHREDHVLHFRKRLASGIEQVWPTAPFRGLILLGDDETIKALRASLAPALANRVVHTEPYSFGSKRPDLDATVQSVLDAALRAQDGVLITDLERRLHEHYLVAAGPQEVINALRNGQVGYPGYLVLERDRGQIAARCTRCESLFATICATCPVCGGTCEKVNLWQQILLFAARHDIMAYTVESHPALTEHGGAAAVLSRSDPWEEAAETAANATGRSS
jgi:peptide subunit release factor 1 (eRF1)